jgi:hypothetical protein
VEEGRRSAVFPYRPNAPPTHDHGSGGAGGPESGQRHRCSVATRRQSLGPLPPKAPAITGDSRHSSAFDGSLQWGRDTVLQCPQTLTSINLATAAENGRRTDTATHTSFIRCGLARPPGMRWAVAGGCTEVSSHGPGVVRDSARPGMSREAAAGPSVGRALLRLHLSAA